MSTALPAVETVAVDVVIAAAVAVVDAAVAVGVAAVGRSDYYADWYVVQIVDWAGSIADQ